MHPYANQVTRKLPELVCDIETGLPTKMHTTHVPETYLREPSIWGCVHRHGPA